MLDLAEIKRRRGELQLTMAEAGQRAGFATAAAQRWYLVESGRRPDPAISTVASVARALECKVDDLLIESERAQPDPKKKTPVRRPRAARKG